MSQQNFSNHARYHPLYHYLIAPLVLVGLIGSIVNLTRCTPETCYSASLLTLVFFILLILGWLVRGYALKADRKSVV